MYRNTYSLNGKYFYELLLLFLKTPAKNELFIVYSEI